MSDETVPGGLGRDLLVWVMVDWPVDDLVSLRVRLEHLVGDALPSDPERGYLAGVLRQVKHAIRTREAWDGREQLTTWARLVREGLSPTAATRATVGIHAGRLP